MEFSTKTLAALAQILASIGHDSAVVLLEKCGIANPQFNDQRFVLQELQGAETSAVKELLEEFVVRTKSARADAGTKYVFDSRLEDLWRCLRLDGWEASGTTLVREQPSPAELVQIRDTLDAALASSPLDGDGGIRASLARSAAAFSNSPPDYNGSTTNVRIALETLVRRRASAVAKSRGVSPPDDTWGASVAFLRKQNILSQQDEAALTANYTITSPGAHVPKGLTDREWARMARALDISWMYYVMKCDAA